MSIELLNIDCMEYMATQPDNAFDLAIVDPPYAWGENVMSYTATPKARKNKRTQKHANKNWNAEPPSLKYWKELKRVSKNRIVWGGNYFPLPISRGWIFWDKGYENTNNFSAGELAWTSFDRILKKIYITNRIMPHEIGSNIHPTQKPVKLYEWLLANYAEKGQRILDTHLGSGSSAIAAHYFGCDLVGCEIDPDYFQAAKARLENETRQVAMF